MLHHNSSCTVCKVNIICITVLSKQSFTASVRPESTWFILLRMCLIDYKITQNNTYSAALTTIAISSHFLFCNPISTLVISRLEHKIQLLRRYKYFLRVKVLGGWIVLHLSVPASWPLGWYEILTTLYMFSKYNIPDRKWLLTKHTRVHMVIKFQNDIIVRFN